MSKHWQTVLSAQAESTEMLSGTKIACEHVTVLEITGADALDFLHGQFSADLLKLQDNAGVLTAWCNPKGRVQHLITVLKQSATQLWLIVPSNRAEVFRKRLQMFVLRSQVTIEDRSDTLALIHTLDYDGNAPESEALEFSQSTQRWYLVAVESLAQTWQRIPANPAAGHIATSALIEYGLPQLDDTIAEKFLPQELDLDLGPGLSFEKGCYPGQEIIARVKFRGEVKRRLQRYQATDIEMPHAGDAIVDSDGAKSGTVVLASPSIDDRIEILAVVDNSSAAANLYLADRSGALTAQEIRR